ncbi:response regulator [Micromonospora sp. DT229]|uniref:response regulator n=1 Tax=Micromonospora sp. DT229 TaxID=3393430 RepID=UPI003CF3FF54
MITVLLVDDHPLVRAGVAGMLAAAEDIEVVGEAGSAAEAVAVARSRRPEVVLMDLRLPDGDGVSATAQILAESPATRVVVLTTYETDTDILRAVEAGAAGYLLKDVTRADLIAAVRTAAGGGTVLAPSVATRLLHQVRRPARGMLSAREVQVLRLVGRGLSNAEIGRELHISEATVKTHLLRTFAKLDVADRTAAVTTAMAAGLL